MSDLLDLRKQLAFYKQYHHERRNVLIHMIFVPTILFTSCCMLQRIKIFGNFTLAHLLSICFGTFYILLCVPTGILASAILLLTNVALTKNWIHLNFVTELTLFIISWIFQFIGHGFFEKRKPALLDNLVQSLVLAPYFILFELLFKLGYMQDLKDQLELDIQESEGFGSI